MKLVTFTFAILLLTNLLIGQNLNTDEKRFISVTGSAEVVLSPDEIELEITLKEYKLKDDNTKVELSKIESNFLKILKKNKVNKQNIMLGNSDYYWYYWWNYRNDTYKKIKYKVSLSSSTDILSLVQDLDTEGVKYLRISNSSNKQLQGLRKDIKISALKAAKDKAIYLLESIDEKLGKVISIEEVSGNRNYFGRGIQSGLSNIALSTNSSDDEIENVKPIKLRYEFKVKFEIE